MLNCKANQSSMVKYKAYLDQQCSGKRPGNTCHMLFPDQHYLHCMREGRDISYAYQTIQLGVYVGGMAEYNIIYKTYSRENVTGSLRTQARCNTGPLCI